MMPFPKAHNSFKLAIAGLFCFFAAHGDIASADEPVVVFRSMEDVRQEIARWDAEVPNQYDQNQIIEVQMDSDKANLGIVLGNDPLGPEVETVVAGSPADMAGMKKGDHLKSINQAKVDSVKDAARLVDRHPVGAVMELEFRRNNYTYGRRIRFISTTEAGDRQLDSSHYLRDRVEELERRLFATQKQNQRLRSAVQFLLDDRRASE